MFTLAIDNLLLGGTFYIERVTEFTVTTTNDKTKALQFNTTDEAELFASNNNIRLVNYNSDSKDEVTSNYYYISC